MKTWIALFRGINVGGHHIVKMAELREGLRGLGFARIASYIQSGNVVFDASGSRKSLTEMIRTLVDEDFGFRPEVLLLSYEDMKNAVEQNPYPERACEPKTLHFVFLAKPCKRLDTKALDEVRTKTERYCLKKNVFYLSAPDGIGRSKLATRIEKALGVPTTVRNFRTVQRLLDMARSDQEGET